MSGMQKKIMDDIKAHVEKRGYEFIQQPNWANTGIVLLNKGYTTFLSFHYDFQNGYAKLQFYPGNKKPVGTCGFTHKDCILNQYIEYSENVQIKISQAFSLINQHLPVATKKPVQVKYSKCTGKAIKMNEFSDNDWHMYAGAECPSDRQEPMIGQAEVKNHPELIATVIVDKCGISVFVNDKEGYDQVTLMLDTPFITGMAYVNHVLKGPIDAKKLVHDHAFKVNHEEQEGFLEAM
jgi:hypothetical protein